jgi:hypothetical protein
VVRYKAARVHATSRIGDGLSLSLVFKLWAGSINSSVAIEGLGFAFFVMCFVFLDASATSGFDD